MVQVSQSFVEPSRPQFLVASATQSQSIQRPDPLQLGEIADLQSTVR